jgi:hypothetical protein
VLDEHGKSVFRISLLVESLQPVTESVAQH